MEAELMVASLGAGKRGPPPFITERLQQIIECVHFEGADGVLIVGGDKYGERHRRRPDRLNDLQTVEPGHLYIEKNEIQRLARDDLYGSLSVCRFQHASDLRVLFEQ